MAIRDRYIHVGYIQLETAGTARPKRIARHAGDPGRVPDSAGAGARQIARLRHHAGCRASHRRRDAARPRHAVPIDSTHARRRPHRGAGDRAPRRDRRRPPPLLPADRERARGSEEGSAAGDGTRRRRPKTGARRPAPRRRQPAMSGPIPEDFHTITPQLIVKGVADAIAWYARAFGANELLRNTAPDGTSIMHAELLLGDSRFFVVDEFPGSMVSPASLGGSPVTLHLYVNDVDTMFDRAVAE